MTRLKWSAARLVAVVLVAAIASTGCSSPPAPKPDPGEHVLSWDFPIDGFDPCSPFTYNLFDARAPATRDLVQHGPGSCRWYGQGITATITDETGATLAEISRDPRYQPGYMAFNHNRYWATEPPTSPPYSAHLFLAVGPAQPRRLLHVHVEAEAERTRSQWRSTESFTASTLARLVGDSIGERMKERRFATTAPARR